MTFRALALRKSKWTNEQATLTRERKALTFAISPASVVFAVLKIRRAPEAVINIPMRSTTPVFCPLVIEWQPTAVVGSRPLFARYAFFTNTD